MSVESGTHEMVLRCFKDSVRTPYPNETDPLITGREFNNAINIYNEDITEL